MDKQHSASRLCFFLTTMMVLLHAPMTGQEDPMRVERIRVVPENLPILNIFVDDQNVKWVANSRTLYKVEAKDLATEVPVGGGEVSLLQFPGGNADIRWNNDAMQKLLGPAKITAASFDKSQNTLWIGTNGYGVFKFRPNPDLRLIEQLHIDNSKLRSDFINSIFVGNNGKVWIATEDGAVSVDGTQWTHHQRYFNILRIRGRGNELWAIGDDLIWSIDRRENWTPIPINRREIEGEIHDIALDKDGRVWIASNIMTAYTIEHDRYRRFGPGQYFTSQFVNFVSVDDDATIWVGTDDKGLYIIEKESTITVTHTIDKYLDCNGSANNAAFTIRAVGGKPPYQFVWAHGATGDQLSGLGPDTYRLTVTDTEGSSKTASVEIPNPFMKLTTKMDRPESGAGKEDGAASVVVDGGVEPYTYEWFSGQGEKTMTGLPEGTYGITVTDAAGCTALATVTVTQIVQPLAIAVEQKEFLRCPGDTNAIVVATHTGGKTPLTYSWSSRKGDHEFQSGLGAGSYTVTATDAVGNTATASFTISSPEALSATIRIDNPATANESNGKATVEVRGGKAPYTYNWVNGESTQTAMRLAPRRHTLTVTDAVGCSTVAAVDISENILPLDASIVQSGENRCAGDRGTSLRITVNGGKEPFTYQWNQQGLNGPEVTGLGGGAYLVTVTDAAGNSVQLSASVAAPAPLRATTVAEAPALSGTNEGHAIVRAEGGTGKLSYRWDNGDTGDKTVSLSPGIHTVTVTDAAGCSVTAEVEILENILPLSATLTQSGEISCAGQKTIELTVAPAGGKGPFTFQWNQQDLSGGRVSGLGAGTYMVTVTDAEGQNTTLTSVITEPAPITVQVTATASSTFGESNGAATAQASGGTGELTYAWSHGQQTAKATGLGAGQHNVTVTDAAGCSVTGVVEISENILPLTAVMEQEGEIRCSGEKTVNLTAAPAGGKPPYRYTWNQNGLAGPQANQVGAGEYSVTISDAEGTETVLTKQITQPDPIVLTVSAEAPSVSGQSNGEASAQASGGTGTLEFAWSNGQKTSKATALPAGNHTITVTDAAGCTQSAEVVIGEDFLPLTVSLTQQQQITCAGTNTGQIAASVTGGKEPYTYVWSNNAGSTARVTDLGAGTYTLVVTDASGQSAERQLSLTEPTALSAEASVVSSASANASDGQVRVSARGGTTPYDFAWSSGAQTPEATGLSAGTYSVTVTDALGCSVVSEIAVTEEILPLQVKVTQTQPIACPGESTAAVEVEVSGGKSPFSFTWDDSGTQQTRTGLAAGTYTVSVSDAAGQQSSASVTITQPATLSGEVIDVRAATHERIPDGKATARVNGGATPYTFAWDNDESAARAIALSVGAHTVTVTDAHGCSVVLSTQISEKILPELTASNLESGEAVRMEQLQFEADSSSIDASSLPTLEELYQFLYDNPTIVVEIGGHTNGLPEHEYCDRLSSERAKAVADYIIDKGIESKRILYKGYGKRQPIATNMTPEGRRRNQRVEVRIVKLSE